ncbi:MULTISPECIES: MFS transporter [Paenibacillus]|uniref:DHA3 family macrolide efflux protein-like MFS transporter n=1 Tax=Paenibacillus pabuli TaxID=1472 RepID=A0ABX9BQA2_9BACL|nr:MULTISPECIES: MFS transporter [Paenibacillus]RAJ00949.1 DHA3 family macrolide efflux protein-like MFS transporter [Paenibacillus pabuli]SEA30217.1 MFS transporter, DHA3 family, macrolide efflux protein [Paenibacillus sp. 276b]SLJ97003.1 MFS transporter, DHA3 family, macrolide efflux protein [Paenibacillus sp. RU5A]SOC67020.1 MFS transporter, DHA3 family, macrolide efflux protein [Paenibacillus sp. RU26A]SOC69831.1 MFS transporter, DHA3 family, macrolide efflux protein [Paenibacillus sp. RU5
MSEGTVARKQGIGELIRIKPYVQFMVSKVVSRFGDSIDSIAYSWMVYILTGSKLLMGTLLAVNFLPSIFLGLFVGALVDRMSPKKVIVLTNTGRGLFVGITALLFGLGELQVWHLFVITILNSLLECFASPAEVSTVPRLLPKSMLLSGNAMASSATRVAELAGLAVAGTLIATAGITWTILIDAGLFALSALLMSRVGYPKTSTSSNNDNTSFDSSDSPPARKSIFSEMTEAFHFMRKHVLLLIVSILFAFVNFCLMPFNVLRTPYVIETLHAGAGGLSLLSGLIVAGMVLSGLWLSHRGSNYRKSVLVIVGIVMLGLSYAMTALPAYMTSYQLPVAAVFCLMMGMGIPLATTPLASYLMEVTPSEMLGRVYALQTMLVVSVAPLGSLVSGALADWVALPILFIVFGVLLAMSAVLVLLSKTFRTVL